jgi:ubiquitin carboxyl-terminal hydrolase 34
LQESERKAYNPRSFCKVYTMDHQPLNTAEQKDMAEFFIDLVSKLEEMTPALKTVVKKLFCGVLSNNVVSLVRSLHIPLISLPTFVASRTVITLVVL